MARQRSRICAATKHRRILTPEERLDLFEQSVLAYSTAKDASIDAANRLADFHEHLVRQFGKDSEEASNLCHIQHTATAIVDDLDDFAYAAELSLKDAS